MPYEAGADDVVHAADLPSPSSIRSAISAKVLPSWSLWKTAERGVPYSVLLSMGLLSSSPAHSCTDGGTQPSSQRSEVSSVPSSYLRTITSEPPSFTYRSVNTPRQQ